MKVFSRTVYCLVMMILVVGFTGLMLAQSPDRQENLFACENGWDTCDPSVLTPANKNEVAAHKRTQNISACENDWTVGGEPWGLPHDKQIEPICLMSVSRWISVSRMAKEPEITGPLHATQVYAQR